VYRNTNFRAEMATAKELSGIYDVAGSERYEWL
jgi:hypothetical protein